MEKIMNKIKKFFITFVGIITLFTTSINVYGINIPSSQGPYLPSDAGRTSQSWLGILVLSLFAAIVIIIIVAISEHHRKQAKKEIEEMRNKENDKENK